MPASTLSPDIDVVRLAPPHLNDTNFAHRRTCLRPMRVGGPRWEVEALSSGIVVHNYGHGPAGWTLAPGSGTYAVELLHQHLECSSTALPLDAPVAIVGAGVIGLFTARALLTAGYTNLTLYAAETTNLTSHNAGGFLAPHRSPGPSTSPATQATVRRLALASYDEWKRIATAAPPTPTVHSAVHPFAAYVHRYALEEDVHGLACYVASGRMSVRDVVVDFGCVKRAMQVYEGGVFMDTGRLMGELLTDVQQRGVRVQKRYVDSIASLHIDHPVVFNCTGHAASTLVPDPASIGALGHTITLQHQPSATTTQPIYSLSMLGHEAMEGGVPVKRAVYLHPRSGEGGGEGEVGLLGGTFVQGVDGVAWGVERNEREWELIVERAREFFYGGGRSEWSGFVHERKEKEGVGEVSVDDGEEATEDGYR